jgi:hypothetical protein
VDECWEVSWPWRRGASSRAQFPASVRPDLDKRGLVKNKLTAYRTSTMFDRYAIVSSVDVLLAQKTIAEFRKQAQNKHILH